MEFQGLIPYLNPVFSIKIIVTSVVRKIQVNIV